MRPRAAPPRPAAAGRASGCGFILSTFAAFRRGGRPRRLVQHLFQSARRFHDVPVLHRGRARGSRGSSERSSSASSNDLPGPVRVPLFPFDGGLFRAPHSDFTVLDPNELAAVTVMALPLALEPFFRGAGGRRASPRGSSRPSCWRRPHSWRSGYSQSRGALIALFAEIIRRAHFPKRPPAVVRGGPSCLASSSLGISGS